MKFIIIVILFLSLINICCISQKKVQLNLNSNPLNLRFTTPTSDILCISSDTNKISMEEKRKYKYLFTPELNSQLEIPPRNEFVLHKKTSSTSNTMPCYKANIISHMPIVVPDSTIRYSILIIEE